MITCIINGHRAYPISTSSIKVTYANQYVTDDGEYTYDITFPMDILANQEIFKNVSRFEVAKNIAKYDDCKLYVDSRIIMSGVGTILSVNQNEVKLQIVGGKSRIKFNEKLTKHYIDEMDLGIADKPGYTVDKGWSQGFKNIQKINDIYRLDDDKSKFLGVEGKWCFVPVRDETNDMIANFVGVDKTKQFIGYNAPFIMNLAVQPSLMYIFRKVVEYEGYTIKRNDYDCKPWNLLYIASAYKTRELRKALPHWSSYTFIEEFRKLFNATIVFDDILKTCSVINASELTTTDSIKIEPMDEYTTDYDEDGSISTSSTANLEYNLGGSANRGSYEVISKKVFENFENFHSEEISLDNQFVSTTLLWSEKKKRQTIIENFGDYYIYVEDENGKKSWKLAGVWSPLIRDKSSEDYVDLNISPAAQVVEDINFKTGLLEDKYYEKRCLLSIPNDKEPDSKESDVDDDGFSYTSVQDAIDDESTLDKSEDDQECMNIFFILPGRVQIGGPNQTSLSWVGNKSRWPQFLTDYRINEDYRYSGIADIFHDTYSLSLRKTREVGSTCLGSFHNNGLRIDNKNSMEVKFKSDEIPDPSQIYIVRNKRFVCAKIEMEVKDDAIEPIYTGYFYMLS